MSSIENKPTVHYNVEGVVYIVIGQRATVNVIDHPRFYCGEMVFTSDVIDYDEGSGVFETLNTIYVPMKTND